MQLLISNKNNYLLAGIAFFVALFTLNATLTTTSASDYPNVKYITPSDAFVLLNNENILVLDVREKDAFNRAHIQNAIAVPIGDLKQRLNEFEAHKTDDIVIYCNEGSIRGPKATAMLNEAGYGGAKNLKGGLDAWRENNYQIVAVKNNVVGV